MKVLSVLVITFTLITCSQYYEDRNDTKSKDRMEQASIYGNLYYLLNQNSKQNTHDSASVSE